MDLERSDQLRKSFGTRRKRRALLLILAAAAAGTAGFHGLGRTASADIDRRCSKD